MSVELLDKTRKINKLLHNNNSNMVVFNDICAVMQDILDSNVLVISKKGKVLGIDKKVFINLPQYDKIRLLRLVYSWRIFECNNDKE